MKIELKSIKYHPDMSQETNAFTAELWIDDQRAGHARNDGGGGDTWVDWLLQPSQADAVLEYARQLPPQDLEGVSLAMSLDFLLALLLMRWLEDREYAKMCRKHLVYRLKGQDSGEVFTLTTPYNPTTADAIRKRYGDKLEGILNEWYLPGATPRPLYDGVSHDCEPLTPAVV